MNGWYKKGLLESLLSPNSTHNEELKRVDIFAEGKKIGAAKAVNLTDNAHVKRQKAPLSFSKLYTKEDNY
jgi:hypothetical protein